MRAKGTAALSGDHNTNAQFYMVVDQLLTFRSKNRNAKLRKNTHCHTHELISSLLIIARPHTGLRAVTPAQLKRDLSDWQLR